MLSEMEQEEMKLVAKIYQKKGQARLKIDAEDTSPDKAMPGSKGGVTKYLSIDRMKAILNKVLPTVGLDYRVQQTEPVYDKMDVWESGEWKESHHYVQHLLITLIDTETGYSVTDDAYGEATNNRDKAMNYSESYALKNWLSATFGFADNLKAEDECIITKEEADKRSEMPKGLPIKIVKKTEPNPKDPLFGKKEEVKETPKTEEKPVEEVKSEQTSVLDLKALSPVQRTAYARMLKEVNENENRFTPSDFANLKRYAENVHDDATYKAFLSVKTVAFQQLPPIAKEGQ